jgi:hypothetical protein
MKKIIPITAATAALVLLTINDLSAAQQKTIVGVAAGAGQFKTLVAAVKAAGLVETLMAKDPLPFLHRPTKPSPSCLREPSKNCSNPRTKRSWWLC